MPKVFNLHHHDVLGCACGCLTLIIMEWEPLLTTHLYGILKWKHYKRKNKKTLYKLKLSFET